MTELADVDGSVSICPFVGIMCIPRLLDFDGGIQLYDLYTLLKCLLGEGGGNSTTIQCVRGQSYWNMHISCVLFASNGPSTYK